MKQFDLDLHPEKTKLIRFGRFARMQHEERGEGKPATFDFLGFTCLIARNLENTEDSWSDGRRSRSEC